jgi:hypothetical protein
MNFRILSVIVVTSVTALATVPANASYSITLDNGAGTSFTIVDNGPADSNSTLGQIGFNNNVVGFIMPGYTTLQITSSSNAPGGSLANLNTTQLDVVSSTATSLKITIIDTGFTSPGVTGSTLFVTNGLTGQLTGGSLGTGTGTATQLTKLDAGSTTSVMGTISPGSPQLPAGLASTALLVRGGPTFTLETDVTVTLSAGFNGNFTHVSAAQAPPNVVPEPASLAVWGGLMMAGVMATVRGCRRS